MCTQDGDAERSHALTGYAGRMALLLAAGWLSILLGRQTLPPLLPTIIEEFAISPARAGAALTLMMGLYAALQYPAGRLSDELSRTTALVASLAVCLLGFGVLSAVATYPGLLAGAALLGAGTALYFSPSRALLSDLFVERRGQALGLQTTAGMGGAALAAGLAVTALSVATWRAAFLPTIVLLCGVVVLVHRWSREPYAIGWVDLDVRGTGGRLLSIPGIRRLLAVRTLVGLVFQGVVGFLPAFLAAEKGFSPGLAGASFASIFVVGAIVGPLAGRLSDELTRGGVVTGGIGLAAVGLSAALVAPAAPVVVVGVVALAAGVTAVFPVMQAFLMDRFPGDSRGADFGAAKTVFTGGGSLGPTYVGVVAERASYATAFAGLVGLLLVAGAVMVGVIASGPGE